MKTLNHISYGLFMKGARLTSKIKDIPTFFSRIFYTLRHGYSPVAVWDTQAWFTDTMQEILREYNKTKHGHPWDTTEESWTEILDTMIALLDDMREDNSKYRAMDLARQAELRTAAKNEFMELFATWFFDLWD